MKKVALLFICVALYTEETHAQEAFSASFGLSINDYSEQFLAAGGLISTDFRFNELISVGTALLLSADLSNIIFPPQFSVPGLFVMEMSVNLRWYFLRFKGLVDYYFEWQNYLHWFIQADIGFSVLSAGGPGMTSNWNGIPFMTGLTAGVRIMFDNWFIEPYVKGGQPFGWGLGFLIGFKLTGKD